MKKLYSYLLLFTAFIVYSQNPADLDPTFNVSTLPANYYDDCVFLNAYIQKKMELQSDGKILVNTGNGLVRIIGNLKDTSFDIGTGFQNDRVPVYPIWINPPCVNAFKQQLDGKIIACGDFTSYNGTAVNNIVRLNSNGSIDNSFNSGSGFNGAIKSMALQADGKIIISGDFTTYNGVSKNKLIRLNSDGSVDNSFSIGTGLGSPFEKIVVQSDGKILGVGDFYSYNGYSGSYGLQLIRINSNGLRDTSFSVEVVNNVDAIALQANGKILVGGTDGMFRLNSNGTVDSSLANQNFYNVRDISVQPDGKILVGGNLDNGNPNRNLLMRLNADGTIDPSYTIYSNASGQGDLHSLLLLSDGKIIMDATYGFLEYGLKKFNSDGTPDTTFNNGDGFSSRVNKILVQPDGKILIGGFFKTYNRTPANGLVRLNSNGSLDSGFNVGTDTNGTFSVTAMALQNDGKIIISGGFTSYNGVPNRGLIRLNADGTQDLSFNVGAGIYLNGSNEIVVQPDGKIIAVGSFGSTLAYTTIRGIIRLNPDGSFDTTFRGGSVTGATYNKTIYAVALQSDGKIIVGGDFRTFNTNNSTPETNYIVRLNTNGTIDPSFTANYYFDNTVYSIVCQPDDKVLVGGNFWGGDIIRLTPNGGGDSSFTSNLINSTVKTITVQPDGKILAGGYFTKYDGVPVYRLVRLTDSQLDPDFNVGIGFNDEVRTIAVQPDGKILVGGFFGSYREFSANNIARLKGGDFYEIKGFSKLDLGNDGCTASDVDYPNIKLRIDEGAITTSQIANTTGSYSFYLDSGSYTLTPVFENPTYYTASPSSITVNFPTQASPLIQNFCITPNGNHPDLEIALLPITPARAGFDAKYKLIYKNKGNQAQLGTVGLTFNDAVLDLVSSVPTVSNQATNAMSWDFTNLQPFETREILLTVNLNAPNETPPLNSGNILNYTATVTSSQTDETPNDNTFALRQTVLGSYDPNDKTCLYGTTVGVDKVGQYAHYVIRFENTGTYNAQNITVTDFIDTNKFDITSLIPVSGSHLFTTKISQDNKVEFVFENINLPYADATNDGYVAFKIKTKSTLVSGDTFSNGASIYFDYNYPITTNTYTTTIQALSTQDFTFADYFTLYPNPTNNILNISTKGTAELQSVQIYNSLGQLVLVIPSARGLSSIDVSNLSSGNYFVKINSDKGSSNTKFIKK